ncbi:MAG TPA: SH3 domain-containing protein [Candidatus Dormibacteraeota bacterium]|nr:SH3 domain-containing protein [Candidatus Dormibacteraeota bacterium]
MTRLGSGAGALAVALALLGLEGCGVGSGPRPTPSPPSPSAKATPSPVPTAVTVLAPDGVNFRSQPSTTASVIGVVAQGVTLPIVSESSADGGWWQVRGSSATGWVTSNPEYISTASFQTYQSGGTAAWSALYPASWAFAQSGSGTLVFTSPGGEAITVTAAPSTAQLPAGAPSGTNQLSVGSVDVYGVTTALVTYSVTTGYLAAVALQATSGLAFLITDKAPSGSAAKDFNLFLDTFKFPLPTASPTP